MYNYKHHRFLKTVDMYNTITSTKLSRSCSTLSLLLLTRPLVPLQTTTVNNSHQWSCKGWEKVEAIFQA